MKQASLPDLPIEPGVLLAHLEAWVVQDGNLPDLSVGDCTSLVLRFEPSSRASPALAAETGAGSLRRSGTRYDATGVVVFSDAELLALDFGGVLAFTTAKAWIRPLSRVLRGDVRFVVDAFEFRESHSRRRRMPKLEREWQVAALFRQPAEGEPPAYLADENELVLAQRTHALDDLGGHATYVVGIRPCGNS